MNADIFNVFTTYDSSDILSSTLGPNTPSETCNLSLSWIKSMNQVNFPTLSSTFKAWETLSILDWNCEDWLCLFSPLTTQERNDILYTFTNKKRRASWILLWDNQGGKLTFVAAVTAKAHWWAPFTPPPLFSPTARCWICPCFPGPIPTEARSRSESSSCCPQI